MKSVQRTKEKNKNNLQSTVKGNQNELSTWRPELALCLHIQVVVAAVAPSPHVGREHFYCRNSCHRCTSVMVAEDDVARNGERVGPPMGSTGGRPHTPS